jgi:hypothetical protein
MEMQSLFSLNTDNLFKFLFINGIVLVVISLFYPIEKEQEFEVIKTDYELKVALFEKNISILKKDIETFKNESIRLENKIDSLKKTDKTENQNKAEFLKNRFNIKLDSMIKIRKEIAIDSINLINNQKKVIIFSNQVTKYSSFAKYFLIVGIISFILGLFGWGYITFINESFKKEELKKLKKENNG